jgi:hypothetical protein
VRSVTRLFGHRGEAWRVLLGSVCEPLDGPELGHPLPVRLSPGRRPLPAPAAQRPGEQGTHQAPAVGTRLRRVGVRQASQSAAPPCRAGGAGVSHGTPPAERGRRAAAGGPG